MPLQGCNWHVWCTTGALEVIEGGSFREWVKENPTLPFTINFANNSSASIRPDHKLWRALKEVAKEYQVGIFPLHLTATEYIPWTGEEVGVIRFDAIRISPKSN